MPDQNPNNPMLPLYIIGTAVNAGLNLLNSRAQREQQRMLRADDYKQTIANQIRTYNLAHAWPLSITDTDLPAKIQNSEIMPLYCIIGPAAEGGVQNLYKDVWTELSNFITGFGNSDYPAIIQEKYKTGFACNPNVDIGVIWERLKSVPVLYIAPYSKDAENILGVTIAMWSGIKTDSAPAPQIFEFDLRKLLIDETRAVTYKYKEQLDQGLGVANNALDENIKIFEKEKEKIENGANFYDLDNVHQLYKNVKTVSAVHHAMMNKITPVLKTICCGLIDSHFVLTYGKDPLFPQVVNSLYKQQQAFPDLLIRNVASLDMNPQLFRGADFLKSLYEDYSKVIARGIEPETGARNIQRIQEALPGCGDCFERALAERWFPNEEEFSRSQIKILDKIAGVDGIEKTEHFSRLFNKRKQLPTVDTDTNNRDIIDDFLEEIRRFRENVYNNGVYIRTDTFPAELKECTLKPSEVLLFFDSIYANFLITEKAEIYAVTSDGIIYEKLCRSEFSYGKNGLFINKHWIANWGISEMQYQQFVDIVNILSDISIGDFQENIVNNEKISDYCNKFRKDFDDEFRIFLSPKIPWVKQTNAIQSYAPSLKHEDILILADNTAWGGAREGFVISKKGWIFGKQFMEKPFMPMRIDEASIIVNNDGHVLINGKEFYSITKLTQHHFDQIKNIFVE